MPSNFLAIDLGASNGRVLLGRWSQDGVQVEELHRFPNSPVSVGQSLHTDAEGLWREVITGLKRYTMESYGPLSGMGVTTWGVDFGLLDGQGKLMGMPHHYRDHRTDGVMERLFQKVPREKVFGTSGIQFMQINTLYQLYSMVFSNPTALVSADSLLLMPDLFHYWLTGRKIAEYTMASTTQMLDCGKRDWATPMLKELGIPTHLLQPVTKPGTILGQLKTEVMGQTDLKTACPVIAVGSHDTASAVAGIPELDADSVFLSSGTWSLMGVELPEPVINEKSLALNFTNEGGVAGTIRLLKNIGGLWPLQECQRKWNQSWPELLALAEKAKPFISLMDPDAPEFLSSADMPLEIRNFCRRTGQPEPADVAAMVRCCLESLALSYRLTLGHLEELVGTKFKAIRVVGGGSQNSLLCQWTADACGIPVIAGPVEATSLGSIMVQAMAVGLVKSVAEGRKTLAPSVERLTYQPGATSAWDRLFERYQKMKTMEAG